MQASCCRRFHCGSALSVSAATSSSATISMVSICCSSLCNTNTQQVLQKLRKEDEGKIIWSSLGYLASQLLNSSPNSDAVFYNIRN